MRIVLRVTACLASLVLLCSNSSAQGVYCGNGVWADSCGANSHVLVTNTMGTTPCPPGSVTISPGQFGGWVINVAACATAGAAPLVTIASGAIAPANIETITVDCPAGYVVELLFAGGFEGVPDIRVGNVKSIARTGAGRLWVSGPILGDLGESPNVVAIRADALRSAGFPGFQVGGDMKGRIVLDGPGVADFLQVDRLAVFGEMDAGLDAMGGSVGLVRVGHPTLFTGGRLGSLGAIVNIRAWRHINGVEAGEINANIRAGHTFTGEDPAMHSNIATVITDPQFGNGRFTGEISAEKIGPLTGVNYPVQPPEFYQINIGGDMGAPGHPGSISLGDFLTNYGAFPDGSNDGVRRIIIGHSFRQGSSIVLPRLSLPNQPSVFSNGLRGQVIINQRNNPSNPGVWEPGAFIAAGDVTISGPTYSAGHNALGGGSVGVAPFDLHKTDCVPPHGSVVVVHARPGVIWNGEGEPPCEFLLQHADQSISRCWVQLRGPVEMAGAGSPLIIERRAFGASSWQTVTDQFDATILPDEDPSFTGNIRSHRIEVVTKLVYPTTPPFTPYHPDFGVDVEYRITPGSMLRCVDVEGANPTPAAFSYGFKIEFDCRGQLVDQYDLNDDGVLDGWDLVQWLYEPEDLNGDNATTETDIWVLFQVIEEYTSTP